MLVFIWSGVKQIWFKKKINGKGQLSVLRTSLQIGSLCWSIQVPYDIHCSYAV